MTTLYVQNQIVSFEEWCNFIFFIENDNKHFFLFPFQQTKTLLKLWSTCIKAKTFNSI